LFKEVPAADSCYADQWAGSFLAFKIGLAFGIHFLYLHVRSKLRWYFQRVVLQNNVPYSYGLVNV